MTTTSRPHPEHLTHPKYRADIDGLRAIAILVVVGFHAFPALVKGGFIGVDIFFVISGFLISTIIIGSLERDSFSFITFYIRRIRRIFPALILVLVASFAFGWFTLLADEYKQLGKHMAGGAGFISNFILWNESGYFDNVAETKPLLHLWSLGVEEQFYFIWPLLLWFAWKQKLNLLSIAIVVGAVSFALNAYEVRGSAWSVAAFYSPQTRFWELMAGSVLAYMALHKQRAIYGRASWLHTVLGKVVHLPEENGKTMHNIQSVCGAALIAAGVFVINKEDYFPGWWALMPVIGAVLIISAGSHAWLNRAVLSNRVLVWFGLISFPLYLWHWPLLSFARILGGEAPSPVIRGAAVLFAIALAWLTYKLIESPIRFGKHGQAKSIVMIVLMIIVGGVGYNCYERDGLIFRLKYLGSRLPKELQTLAWTEHDQKELMKKWHEGICSFKSDTDAANTKGCEEDKPVILIWGDSYAGHLYPGYKASFGEANKIVVKTSSACGPILNMEIQNRPHCKEFNDHLIEQIEKERPNKVVLAADWPIYDWKKVEGTISQLHKVGIKNIDLIGSVPQWKDSLYKQLYLRSRLDESHQIPYRMTFGLNQNFIQLEPQLSVLATQLGVNYISPKNIMCNEDGCITRFGETGDTLTTFDGAHLTEMASVFLVSKFPRN